MTNDYLVTAINGMFQEICDLVITLEDADGKQIPADADNGIQSVTVQNQVGGQPQGEPATYTTSGTQVKVNLDPCIPKRPSAMGVAGADVTITAKTDKNFNRIHITASKKKPETDDHYTIAGNFDQLLGTDAALPVGPLNSGIVFFVTNSDPQDALMNARFRLAGASMPSVLDVEVDDATEPFTVTTDPDGKGFSLSAGVLAPGAAMEVWVDLSGAVTGDAAILGTLMRG